ncbi:MAG: multidrug ABC transporter permease [Blastopirellula sp.]|nr:MAG: multidrug ABC transporter permease [Blastopirellula sp.]
MSESSFKPVVVNPWNAAWSLCWRELVRFLRQRNRVIGAIGQPILFWLLFGAGMNQTFSEEATGANFLEYYVSGTIMLIVLFTAIFATISIIEDRKEGFLQAVLVAPIPRWSMVLGKVMGGTILAVMQGMLFLILASMITISIGPLEILAILFLLIVIGIGLTSLGFVLAWRMDSTQGFHAIMNLLLMPMWLLSGAFFPVPSILGDSSSGAPSSGDYFMHWIMRCNPLTYAMASLREIMYWGDATAPLPGRGELPSFEVNLTVTLLFALIMFILACRVAREPAEGDLR